MLIFYAHGGSDNHGCEAIIRGTLANINEKSILLSGNSRADKNYGLSLKCDVISDSYKRYEHPVKWLYYKILSKINKKNYAFSLVDGKIKGNYLSVGGDNYCYKGLIQPVINVNNRIREQGNDTYLWGTSIEPEVLKDKNILKDIEKYKLIFARESITYNALCNCGLKEKTYLFPDPAFAMIPKKTEISFDVKDKKIIGLNISPLIFKYEKNNNCVSEGYKLIINYILDNSDYDIMFIPHVVKRNNNDLDSILALSKQFNTDRIHILQDKPADELKYCISKCDVFVGARTHSTIAAYSTCVPTLVIGYSVKAKGIAKDIFGSYQDYIVDVRNITSGTEILEKFINIYNNRKQIKNHLEEFMPEYISKTKNAVLVLKESIDKKEIRV